MQTDNKKYEINLKAIFEKNDRTMCDILLAMCELGKNPQNYKYVGSSKTDDFWDAVKTEENIGPLFKNYKANTLKKYWYFVTCVEDIDVYIDTVLKYSWLFDLSKLKLETIVKSVTFYLTGIIPSLEEYVFSKATLKLKTIIRDAVINRQNQDSK